MSTLTSRRTCAHVALALNSIPKCEASYGEFYVGEATILFDSEPTQFSVVADEHGSYSIRVRSLS